MKKITSIIVAVVLTIALAVPTFADYKEGYLEGLDVYDAYNLSDSLTMMIASSGTDLLIESMLDTIGEENPTATQLIAIDASIDFLESTDIEKLSDDSLNAVSTIVRYSVVKSSVDILTIFDAETKEISFVSCKEMLFTADNTCYCLIKNFIKIGNEWIGIGDWDVSTR